MRAGKGTLHDLELHLAFINQYLFTVSVGATPRRARTCALSPVYACADAVPQRLQWPRLAARPAQLARADVPRPAPRPPPPRLAPRLRHTAALPTGAAGGHAVPGRGLRRRAPEHDQQRRDRGLQGAGCGAAPQGKGAAVGRRRRGAGSAEQGTGRARHTLTVPTPAPALRPAALGGTAPQACTGARVRAVERTPPRNAASQPADAAPCPPPRQVFASMGLYYPERLGRVVVVNAPRWVDMPWCAHTQARAQAHASRT